MGTFCEETGVKPEHVYLAPYDRQAAEANGLPFFERPWPLREGRDADSEQRPKLDSRHPTPESRRSLLEDLSQLRFGEIKLRTLRGSIEQLTDEETGLPAYLREVSSRSEEFAKAAELLSTHQLAEIDNWPEAPNAFVGV